MSDVLLQRAFYGTLALLSLLALGLGLVAAGAEGAAFSLFAIMTIGGALACIWERSVVRSAFALMATFTGVAGFFVLLESDFLAMAQILIYVGGILALLLFGVMLTPPDMSERKLVRVLGALAFMGAGTFWIASQVSGAKWVVAAELPEVTSRPKQIGAGFLAMDMGNGQPGYVVAFELAAVLLTVALVAAVYIARRKSTDLVDPGGNA